MVRLNALDGLIGWRLTTSRLHHNCIRRCHIANVKRSAIERRDAYHPSSAGVCRSKDVSPGELDIEGRALSYAQVNPFDFSSAHAGLLR